MGKNISNKQTTNKINETNKDNIRNCLDVQIVNNYITGRLKDLYADKHRGTSEVEKKCIEARENELLDLWHFVNKQ